MRRDPNDIKPKTKNLKPKTKIMKKSLSLIFALFVAIGSFAQNAKATMDKAVAALQKSSVTASYSATGQLNDAGTLKLKGNKYCATGKTGTIWFDGKTQWTYMKSTDEVNIVTPNSKKVSVLNPYAVLNLYKSGYTLSQKKVAAGTEVYMKATGNQTYKEIYVTLNAKLQPVSLRFLNSKGWTTVTLSNYQTKNLPDSTFKFNKKQYPSAEINDLR